MKTIALLLLVSACEMSGLEKRPVELPIVGGIDSKTAPFAVAPGSFLQLDDVRQERTHEWRNRNSIPVNALDAAPAAILRSAELPGGGLFALDSGGTNVSAGLVWSKNVPTGTSHWRRLGLTSIALVDVLVASQSVPGYWKRRAVGAEGLPIYHATIAEGNSMRFIAWKPGNGGGGSTEDKIRVTIVDSTSGATILPTTVIGAASGNYPKAVYMDAAKLFVLVWADGANLNAAKWDATTGAFVSGPTTLKTNFESSGQLDACYYSGSTFTVSYVQVAGTTAHHLEVNPSTFALSTDVNLAVLSDEFLGLLTDPDASGIRFFALSNSSSEVRVLRVNSAGAIQSNNIMDTVASGCITGVAYEAGAGFHIVYSDIGANGKLKAVKKTGGFTGTPADLTYDGGPNNTLASTIDSAAWREPGRDEMHWISGIHNGVYFDASTADYQQTYFEMAVPFNIGVAENNSFTEPQARLLPLNAGLPPQTVSLSTRFQAPTRPVRTGTGAFALPLMRISVPQLAAGTFQNRYAVDTWDVQYLSTSVLARTLASGTRLNLGPGATGSQAGYIPAGMLLQSVNGTSIVGHGAGAQPYRPVAVVAAGGAGLTLGQSYQYIVTTEYSDEVGNVWSSAPSVASNRITPTAGNLHANVTVYLSPFENWSRMRTVKIWRTAGNGTLFQLVNQRTLTGYVSNCTFVFTDTVPDSSLVQSNVLPVRNPGDQTGVLPNTITPAFNHITFFDNRMWGAERDFPKRIRYTQKNQTGVTPGFPLDFFVDLEDEFGDITGMQGLDDKILAFKENAIYWAPNGGPNEDGSGTFYAFLRISSAVGALPGTPTVSTGSHVYFFGHNGIYRIDRSLNIEFIGKPLDRWFNQPLIESTQETPISFTFNQTANEIRLLTSNYRFVYDLIHEIWIRDTGAIASSIATQRVSGIGDAFLRTNGETWWDYDDDTIATGGDGNGGTFQGTIRSPWFRLAGPEGYFRLYRARTLWDRDPAVTTTAWPETSLYVNDSDIVYATETQTGTSGFDHQAIEMRTAKAKLSSFSLKVTLPIVPTEDRRWRLTHWVVVAGIKQTLRATGSRIG